MPAGVPISVDYINSELAKRQKGAGSGGRMLIEKDEVELLSGVRFGKTIASPIAMVIWNKDNKNWGERMSHEEQPSDIRESARVTEPRPGHVDLPGAQKYGFDDARNVLERASARETTARVAAGAVFKQLLAVHGIEIASHTLQIGDLKTQKEYDFEDIKSVYEKDPEIRCVDPETSQRMKDLINQTRKEMNTFGGIVETWAVGVPVGLGSYVHWDRKIDGQIAQALMSIQSVKAVEIGSGVENASQFGSEVHDEIYYSSSSDSYGRHTKSYPSEALAKEDQRHPGEEQSDDSKIDSVQARMTQEHYYRKTNRAGGIEGGVTNGMPVIVRSYHKPISTLYKPMNTVDIETKETVKATVERSDICVVPRGGIVSEAMLSYVLAQEYLRSFGDHRM